MNLSNDKDFIEFLIKNGATVNTNTTNIFKTTILSFFILSILLTPPLFADLPRVDLDLSGLDSLSKMGKKLTKASQYKTVKEQEVLRFKTKQEVLTFHNDFVNANPDIARVINRIPKDIKPTIYLNQTNRYEVIYILNNEKLVFYYYFDSSLSNLYIQLTQNSIHVWTQITKFSSKNTSTNSKAYPYTKKDHFFDGTVQKTEYTYNSDNSVSLYKRLSHDKVYKVQPIVLLAYEEGKRLINTQNPLASYIQSYVLDITQKYRNSKFEKTISSQKFTLKWAEEHCDSLSIDGYVVWHLPREKDLLSLSTNTPIKKPNGNLVYIKKDYFDTMPLTKDNEDLTFWTSNLTLENDYELGRVVSFSHSVDELENAPIDLASDKKTKHYVMCKKAQNPINIRWNSNRFISIYGNNYRLSPPLKLIGSFDMQDGEKKSIDVNNALVNFPLKDILIVSENNHTLYLLDLEKQKKVEEVKINNNTPFKLTIVYKNEKYILNKEPSLE